MASCLRAASTSAKPLRSRSKSPLVIGVVFVSRREHIGLHDRDHAKRVTLERVALLGVGEAARRPRSVELAVALDDVVDGPLADLKRVAGRGAGAAMLGDL